MRFEEVIEWDDDEIDLSSVNFVPELVARIPRHVALRYRVLPLSASDDDRRLEIAIGEKPDLAVADSLAHLLNRDIRFRAADVGQLESFIERIYGK